MKHFLLFILVCSLLQACSKDAPSSPVNPIDPVPPVNYTDPTQYGTPFSSVADRRDAVIYQVNMRVFDQTRNFQAVTNRLDAIKALGTNVVYLMPIYPVGQLNAVNSPYCVRNYTAVNPEFGTLADLRTLVENAHAKNMSVILDWVANHTSWDNPWIAAHKDWYLQDGNNNIVSPPGTGWNDVAQLNFNNSQMRLEMIRNMKFWIFSANIDGFRCDYTDGPPVDFWQQAIDTLRNIGSHHLLLLAEGSRAANYSAGFDFNFGFGFYGVLKSIYNSNTAVTSIDAQNTVDYTNASNGQQMVRYLTNHDVNGSDGTPLDLFGGKAGSLAAFVVVATMNSVPMIYNGQEVGTPDRIQFPFTGNTIDWSINPDITAAYKRILSIRNNSAAIRRGVLTSFSNTDVCAFTKEIAGEKVFIAINLRNNTNNFSLPATIANNSWTDLLNGGTVNTSGIITLPPYGYTIYRQ